MKARWTQESLERLSEIEDFIAKDSPARAALFVEQIIAHVEVALPENPGWAEWCPKSPILR